MKLTKCFLFVTFTLTSLFLKAQNYTVRGKVVSGKTNEPLIGVSISLLKLPDSTAIKSLASNLEGEFAFTNVQPQSYIIKASFIGAKTSYKKITIINHDIDLENIALQENTEILKEVKIETVQIRVEQKGDTTQY